MTTGKPICLASDTASSSDFDKLGFRDRQAIGFEDLLGFDLGQGSASSRAGILDDFAGLFWL